MQPERWRWQSHHEVGGRGRLEPECPASGDETSGNRMSTSPRSAPRPARPAALIDGRPRFL